MNNICNDGRGYETVGDIVKDGETIKRAEEGCDKNA